MENLGCPKWTGQSFKNRLCFVSILKTEGFPWGGTRGAAGRGAFCCNV